MKKLHWKESNEKEPSVLPFCNEVCHWSWISQALMAALISRKNGKIEKTLINHYTPHSHNNKSEFPYTLRDGIDQETQSLDLLLARGVYYTIIWSWFKGLKDLKTHGAWAPHTPDFQANSEPPGKTIYLKAQILHKSCCTSQETVGTNLAAHHKRLWAQILHKSYCTSQEILGTNLAQILLHITRDSGHKSCTNLAQILLHITRDCGPPSLKCHQMPPCPQDEGKVGIWQLPRGCHKPCPLPVISPNGLRNPSAFGPGRRPFGHELCAPITQSRCQASCRRIGHWRLSGWLSGWSICHGGCCYNCLQVGLF